MSMTDPIADLLTRIRNAHVAKHDRLDVPASKLKLEVCRLLQAQGFIADYGPLEAEGEHARIRIVLRYTTDGSPVIRHLQRVSRPGRRVYRSADDIPTVLNGLGVGIVSTPLGLLTDSEARERRVGGEILCEVW
jgi:small subunit ribosomal protein S8